MGTTSNSSSLWQNFTGNLQALLPGVGSQGTANTASTVYGVSVSAFYGTLGAAAGELPYPIGPIANTGNLVGLVVGLGTRH